MTYHTYSDEKRAEMADKLIRQCANLIQLLTHARTLDGMLQMQYEPHGFPIVDHLKRTMEQLNNDMAHMTASLNGIYCEKEKQNG